MCWKVYAFNIVKIYYYVKYIILNIILAKI